MCGLRKMNVFLCLLLLMPARCLLLPLNLHPQNSSQSADDKNQYKKGIIRIAGPWHSDSALDRNVDPGEDSYVKKIISSNEGINFNKDIAEAGEMFDVNGIEDFYDKNAMITYEINGHEIPVHLKPKLTPQSKSLFPEYIRDSPAAMGLARDKSISSSSNGGRRMNNIQSNVISTFTGMSLNDMPEYRSMNNPTSSKPMNLQKDQETVLKSIQSFVKPKDSKKKKDLSSFKEHTREIPTDTQFHEQISQTGRQDAQLSENLQNTEQMQLPNRAFNGPNSLVYPEEYARISQNSQQNEVNQAADKKQDLHFRLDQEQEQSPPKMLTENFQKINGKVEEPTLELQIENKDIQSDKAGTKDTVPIKLSENAENNMEQTQNQEQKATEEVLFEKLENLHNNLEKDKLINEADIKSMTTPGDSDPKKAKAKARILNLLGALTDKLKGMESIVAGNREKKLEKLTQESAGATGGEGIESVQSSEFHSSETQQPGTKLYGENVLQNKLQQQQSFVSPDSVGWNDVEPSGREMNDMTGVTSQLSEFHNLPNAEISYSTRHLPSTSKETTENAKEREDELMNAGNQEQINKDSPMLSAFSGINLRNQKIDKEPHKDESDAHVHGRSEALEDNNNLENIEEKKHTSEIIEKFRDHNKPFVMNTNSIDFKPSEENDNEPEIEKINEEGEEEITAIPSSHHSKDVVRFHNNDDEQEDDENEIKPNTFSFFRSKASTTRHNLYHHKTKDVDDNTKEIKISDDDENDDDGTKIQRVRKKKHRHRHRFRNENDLKEYGDEETKIVRHHRRRHVKHNDDEYDNDTHDDDDENDNKDTEVDRVNAAAEDLASADEKRESSPRPSESATEEVDYPDYNDVKDAAIFETNLIRKRFHAKPINWSDKLSDKAQSQAEKLARISDLEEKSLYQFRLPGEDIAMVNINSTNVGKDAPDNWARESKFYDFRSPQVSSRNIDFAQMVWKSGNEFGLGVAKAKSARDWVVTSMFDTPVIDHFKDLKMNLESDVPIEDPYSDIQG